MQHIITHTKVNWRGGIVFKKPKYPSSLDVEQNKKKINVQTLNEIDLKKVETLLTEKTVTCLFEECIYYRITSNFEIAMQEDSKIKLNDP